LRSRGLIGWLGDMIIAAMIVAAIPFAQALR
jgi:hypothetical protein